MLEKWMGLAERRASTFTVWYLEGAAEAKPAARRGARRMALVCMLEVVKANDTM